jgi:serine phosphatase RsbU (regulator of sigma subunit)
MATSRFSPNPQGPLVIPLKARTATGAARRAPEPEHQELRVAMLERERHEVQQELFAAAQVQRRLSGARRLQRGPFEIASEVFPAGPLGGDFICSMEINAQTWIALGDIAGKGLAAAMWFTHLVSLIRCYGTAYGSAAAVLTVLNRDLCALQPEPPLTSVVLLVLDSASESVEYSNGGHPAPLLLRRGDSVERLEAGGPLLGVVSGAAYESARLKLSAGDLLLGCTDGVLECRNAADEEFGYARLVRVARAHADEPAPAALFSILGAAQDFAADTPRHDDISLLVIRHGK